MNSDYQKLSLKWQSASLIVIVSFLLVSISCANFESEKTIAEEASSDFYERLTEEDLAKSLKTSEATNKDKLVAKLEIVRETIGEIKEKKLKNVKAWLSDEKIPMVSCTYEIAASGKVWSQELIWRVENGSARLFEVFTTTFDEKGKPAVLVHDGKIIY